MAWIYLLVAGLLEVVWATSLKHSAEKFSVPLLILTIVAMMASIAALYAAMRDLPLGVAYPLWTGIGAVGSIIFGVIMLKESITITTIAGVIFLIAGMILIGLKTQH